MFGYTMYACARARKCVHVHAFVHLRAGMGVCVHACVRACVPACLHACVPACLRAYVRACRILFQMQNTYIHITVHRCLCILFI